VLSPADKVRGLLPGRIKVTGRGMWQAQCPAHEDKIESLSIKEELDGKVLLHCHAGCRVQDIVHALNLHLWDLFPGPGKADLLPVTQYKLEDAVERYEYVDEHGEHLYTVARFEPKAFRMFGPNGERGRGIRRVPYNLQMVLRNPGEDIFIVEGEKDADYLAREHDLVATTNEGGAGKWDPNWAKYFEGRDVYIIPDNDDPGRKHASQIAESLHEVAQKVAVVNLPGDRKGYDISDYFTDYFMEEFLAMVGGAREWVPDDVLGDVIVGDGLETGTIKPVTWREVWETPPAKPFLEIDGSVFAYEREIVRVSGDPGVGKSFLLLALTFAQAMGTQITEHVQFQGGRSLWVDEEGSSDILMERIRLMHKANFEDVVMDRLDANMMYFLNNGIFLDQPQAREQLFRYVDEYKPAVVVIDSATRIHLLNENSASDMSRLHELAFKPLSREYGCTVFIVDHTRKVGYGEQDDTVHGTRGSGDKGAAVDRIWYLANRDKRGEPAGFSLKHSKVRRGIKPNPVDFIRHLDDDGILRHRLKKYAGLAE
jgi:KaiC/GvpD/RAD55 family RecA-like ATPase